MPKLQSRKSKTGNTFTLVIPKELVDLMKWEKGDLINIEKIDNERLCLKKAA